MLFWGIRNNRLPEHIQIALGILFIRNNTDGGEKMRENKHTGRGELPYVPEGALRGRSECAAYMVNRRTLEDAMREGVTLEAMCTMCDGETMQLSVELPDGIHGIIPREEACYAMFGEEIKDIAIITRVGKPVQFKIMDIRSGDGGQTIAYLSRRAAQEECAAFYVSRLERGDIIPARITHLEPFGAFCDIGCGLVSLLTVDKISVSRISHPADRFRVGEFTSVVVHSIADDGRIYLTHRELLGTWEENAAEFAPGQTVTGIIRSIEDYGVFVELAPNLAGLAELCDGVNPGETCSVYIKSIIPERMKVKLVLIDTCGPAALTPCRYFIDTERVDHISRWVYSPEGSSKTVMTDFTEAVAAVKR